MKIQLGWKGVTAIVGLAIAAILLGWGFYNQYKSANNYKQLLSIKNKELMTANLKIGRAATKLVEQKLLHESTVKTLNKEWQKEIQERKALLSQYSELKAELVAEKKKVKVVTKVVYRDKVKEIKIDLPPDRIFVRNGDSYKQITSIPWQYSDFRIDISGDALKKELSYRLHQIFRARLIETELPSGGYNHYAEIYEVDPKGKKVGKLKITKYEVLKKRIRDKRFFWWAPKVDLNVSLGLNLSPEFTWGIAAGFSPSGYGRTKNDLMLRFVKFNLGINRENGYVSVTPITYNIGDPLPLVSNIWIGPEVGLDFERNVFAGINLGVVF